MITLLRRSVVAAFVFCLAAPAALAAEQPARPDTLRFGAAVTAKKAVNIAKLAKNPAKFAGQEVRLEGIVKDVCQGRGCWVEVANSKGKSFLARSLDESVLLPKDCHGYMVVVQGIVTALPAKVAEEPVEEGHACPRPTYVVSTQGVELIPAR